MQADVNPWLACGGDWEKEAARGWNCLWCVSTDAGHGRTCSKVPQGGRLSRCKGAVTGQRQAELTDVLVGCWAGRVLWTGLQDPTIWAADTVMVTQTGANRQPDRCTACGPPIHPFYLSLLMPPRALRRSSSTLSLGTAMRVPVCWGLLTPVLSTSVSQHPGHSERGRSPFQGVLTIPVLPALLAPHLPFPAQAPRLPQGSPLLSDHHLLAFCQHLQSHVPEYLLPTPSLFFPRCSSCVSVCVLSGCLLAHGCLPTSYLTGTA